MTKGFGGIWDMGYGLYDYYVLGEYAQKFTIRTRHGNRAQLDAMIQALPSHDLMVMAGHSAQSPGSRRWSAPNQSAGSHQYHWDAIDLAPGMYTLRV
ncbi:MAG: hypothetical protein AAF804_07970, partial [Bacteroidota bacterium]